MTYTSPLKFKSLSPYELFGIPLEQEVVTKLEKVNKQENSLITNKQIIEVTEKENQTDI